MNGKKFDFSSNRQNKYAIRKITVGTGSIVVGMTLLFGLHNEAHAQETNVSVYHANENSHESNIDTEGQQASNPLEKSLGHKSQNNIEKVATTQSEEQPQNVTKPNTRNEVAEAKDSPEKETISNSEQKLDKKPESNMNTEQEKKEQPETTEKTEKPQDEIKENEAQVSEVTDLTSEQQHLTSEEVTNVEEKVTNVANKDQVATPEKSNDTTKFVTTQGTNHFKAYGDVIHKKYPQEFPEDGILTAINNKPGESSSGALEYDKKIDFNKDFTIKVPIANNNQGNTTDSDGWGFIFTDSTGQDFLNKGGILRDKGIAKSLGFKIDTSFNNVNGNTDAMDKDEENNLKEVGNASKIGYGTFVYNDENGISRQVGLAVNSKDHPTNKIQYADNTTNQDDGQFHGQRLNDVILKYNTNTGKLSASYAGKTWEVSVDELGFDKSKPYHFLITSSKMTNRFSNGIMRTKLEGINITTPQEEIVDGTPEVTTTEIPFKTKREFNPDLAPGTESVKQKGKPGEKTTTIPTLINPITGEKVGEGTPVEKVTKEPIDEIIEFGGEEVPQGHKDEFDPKLPVDQTEKIPGKPGVKNPETGEVIVPPVDDVIKHGPKAGTPEVTTTEIPFETKREFNPDLAPGTESVKQKGKPGEKTTTIPTLINPITGEKVGEGTPVEKVTKEPIDEIIEFGGEKVPQGHKDETGPTPPGNPKKEKPIQHHPDSDKEENHPNPTVKNTGENPSLPNHTVPHTKEMTPPLVVEDSGQEPVSKNVTRAHLNHKQHNNVKRLPDTGSSSSNNSLVFGSFLTALGSLLIVAIRRRKQNKSL